MSETVAVELANGWVEVNVDRERNHQCTVAAEGGGLNSVEFTDAKSIRNCATLSGDDEVPTWAELGCDEVLPAASHETLTPAEAKEAKLSEEEEGTC